MGSASGEGKGQLPLALPASAAHVTDFSNTKHLKFEKDAISVAVPKEWDDLPPHILAAKNSDDFKQRLKTFSIRKCYQLSIPSDFMKSFPSLIIQTIQQHYFLPLCHLIFYIMS